MTTLLSFLGELIDVLAPVTPTLFQDLENLVAQKKTQYQPVTPQIEQQDAATLKALQGK